MDAVFNKALELAMFAPLMPVVERIKVKDLHGAAALVVSTTGVLQLVSKFDVELPRTLLKMVLQKQEVQDAVEEVKSRMPTPALQEPFQKLQAFSQNLDAAPEVMLSEAEEVFGSFKKSADALATNSFKFPQDLIKQIDPADVLQALATKIPAAIGSMMLLAMDVSSGVSLFSTQFIRCCVSFLGRRMYDSSFCFTGKKLEPMKEQILGTEVWSKYCVLTYLHALMKKFDD